MAQMPLYSQIKTILLERIQNQIYAVGKKIPSEPKLCAELGVSRPTVRQAIAELINEGYLEIKKGKGTYVLDRDTICFIDPFNTFTFSFLASLSFDTKAILHIDHADFLPDFLLEAYGVDPKDEDAQEIAQKFWKLTWLASQHKLPYAYSSSYIPISMFPLLKLSIEERKNLKQIIGSKQSFLPIRGMSSFQSTFATPELGMKLNCNASSLVYDYRTILFSHSGDICEVNSTMIRSDRVKLKLYSVGSMNRIFV